MNKSLKNFTSFLKENWSDKLEEFVDDIVEDDKIVSDENGNEDDVVIDEEEPAVNDVNLEPETDVIEEPKEEQTEKEEDSNTFVSNNKSCKVLFLCGVVSSIGKESINCEISDILKDKIGGESKEIQLFQLNIQPATEGEEPMDGMVQVYDAIADVDAIIVCSDLKKGQVSSVLQATMERLSNHFKHKELRNKVFGSVITGEEDAHQNVKSSLLNFANNMGMIVGGDCNVFCCLSEGETLGSCSHDYEAETSTTAVCIKELCYATASIRSSVSVQPVEVEKIDKPTAISSLLNFDEFDKDEDDDVTTDNVNSDTEISDEEEKTTPMNFDEFLSKKK